MIFSNGGFPCQLRNSQGAMVNVAVILCKGGSTPYIGEGHSHL